MDGNGYGGAYGVGGQTDPYMMTSGWNVFVDSSGVYQNGMMNYFPSSSGIGGDDAALGLPAEYLGGTMVQQPGYDVSATQYSVQQQMYLTQPGTHVMEQPQFILPGTSENCNGPTGYPTINNVQAEADKRHKCQLCRWQSDESRELLTHMQEYHHIDTAHVVSRQASSASKTSSSGLANSANSNPGTRTSTVQAANISSTYTDPNIIYQPSSQSVSSETPEYYGKGRAPPQLNVLQSNSTYVKQTAPPADPVGIHPTEVADRITRSQEFLSVVGGGQFRCQKCSATFPIYSTAFKHARECHFNKSNRCGNCGLYFLDQFQAHQAKCSKPATNLATAAAAGASEESAQTLFEVSTSRPVVEEDDGAGISTEVQHLTSIMRENLECLPGPGKDPTYVCQLCKSSFTKKKTAEAHLWIVHIRTEWAETCDDSNVDDVYLQYLEAEFTSRAEDVEPQAKATKTKENNVKQTLAAHLGRPRRGRHRDFSETSSLTPATTSSAVASQNAKSSGSSVPTTSATNFNAKSDRHASFEARAVKFMRPDRLEFFCTVCKIRATKSDRLIQHIVAIHFGAGEPPEGKKDLKKPAQQRRSWKNRVEKPWLSGGNKLASQMRSNTYVDPTTGKVRRKWGRPFTKNMGGPSADAEAPAPAQASPASKPQSLQGTNYYVDTDGKVKRKRGRPFSNVDPTLEAQFSSLAKQHGRRKWLPWEASGSKAAQQLRSNFYVDPNGKLRRKWGRPFTTNLNESISENPSAVVEGEGTSGQGPMTREDSEGHSDGQYNHDDSCNLSRLADDSKGYQRVKVKGKHGFYKCSTCKLLFSRVRVVRLHSRSCKGPFVQGFNLEEPLKTGESEIGKNDDPSPSLETGVDPETVTQESFCRGNLASSDHLVKKYLFRRRVPPALAKPTSMKTAEGPSRRHGRVKFKKPRGRKARAVKSPQVPPPVSESPEPSPLPPAEEDPAEAQPPIRRASERPCPKSRKRVRIEPPLEEDRLQNDLAKQKEKSRERPGPKSRKGHLTTDRRRKPCPKSMRGTDRDPNNRKPEEIPEESDNSKGDPGGPKALKGRPPTVSQVQPPSSPPDAERESAAAVRASMSLAAHVVTSLTSKTDSLRPATRGTSRGPEATFGIPPEVSYECKLCAEVFVGKSLLKYHLVSVHYGALKSTGDAEGFEAVESLVLQFGKEVPTKSIRDDKSSLSTGRSSPDHIGLGKRRGSRSLEEGLVAGKSKKEGPQIDLKNCSVRLGPLRWDGVLPLSLLTAANDLCEKLGSNEFHCKKCGSLFKTQSACFSHARVEHFGERRNQCHVCSKYFTDPAFQVHIMNCGTSKFRARR